MYQIKKKEKKEEDKDKDKSNVKKKKKKIKGNVYRIICCTNFWKYKKEMYYIVEFIFGHWTA